MTLGAILLGLSISTALAAPVEGQIISTDTITPAPIGSAYIDTSLPAEFSEEVALWSESSSVLQDGIRQISRDTFANSHPELVITHPSLLIYPPETNTSRAAIIVFPGGGYKGVAIARKSTIGFNGADVCGWLNEAGVTCIILKYRVPNTGCNYNKKTRQHETPDIPLALQDAQRAISTVRFNAEKYGIDPKKIGVLGFSAGGNLAVLSSTSSRNRTYTPLDEIDQVSSRPDFAIPVYPGHMTMEHKNKRPKSVAAQELNTDIEVTDEVPPTLLIHAEDDPTNPVYYSELYESALKGAGVKVDLITYRTGGHAFGVKKQNKESDRWTADTIHWLMNLKIL
nr:alpha/beta hydrolase [Microbulbifer sp. CAU 1566]